MQPQNFNSGISSQAINDSQEKTEQHLSNELTATFNAKSTVISNGPATLTLRLGQKRIFDYVYNKIWNSNKVNSDELCIYALSQDFPSLQSDEPKLPRPYDEYKKILYHRIKRIKQKSKKIFGEPVIGVGTYKNKTKSYVVSPKFFNFANTQN